MFRVTVDRRHEKTTMEGNSTRFTALEGGARVAASCNHRNTLAVEYAAFISTRLIYEQAHTVRGSLYEGQQRSIHITRASRVPVVAHELSILTDLTVAQAIDYDGVYDWYAELDKKEVLVCTSSVLQRILEEEILTMESINVLVVDSCHLVWIDGSLKYIMKLYKEAEENNRPRILALTYPLFNSIKKDDSPKETAIENPTIDENTTTAENPTISETPTISENSTLAKNPSKSENLAKEDDNTDLTDKEERTEEKNLPQLVENDECKMATQDTLIEGDNEKALEVSNKEKITESPHKSTPSFSMGVYENYDDLEMYEKLEWKIEQLEDQLSCQMDLAEDIDGGKRLSATIAKPKEVVIEYKPHCTEQQAADCTLLEQYMRDIVSDALEFLSDHRYDPTEIYGEDLYEEFKNIPDPTIDPTEIFHQFIYVLDELGPYGADKAAFSLLTKLEKLKIKVPYERHFLLLCVCTSVFVKIRCHADYVFSKYESDWDKIRIFSTPKVLRFAEILEQFQAADSKKEDSKNDKDVQSQIAIDSCKQGNLNSNNKNVKLDQDIDNSNKELSHANNKGIESEKATESSNHERLHLNKNLESQQNKDSCKQEKVYSHDKNEKPERDEQCHSFESQNNKRHGEIETSKDGTMKKDDRTENSTEKIREISNDTLSKSITTDDSKDSKKIKEHETKLSKLNEKLENKNTNEHIAEKSKTFSDTVHNSELSCSNKDEIVNQSEETVENQDSRTNLNKKTNNMLKAIENCDFRSLSDKIEDKLNTIQCNLKDIDLNEPNDNYKDEIDSKVINDISTHVVEVSEKEVTNKTECSKNETDVISNEIIENHDTKSSKTNRENTKVNVNAKMQDSYDITNTKQEMDTKTSQNELKLNEPEAKGKEIINFKANEQQSVNAESNTVETDNKNDPKNLFPRRTGHRTRGRGRVPRNNLARAQQMLQQADALCGLVFLQERLMAHIMFLLIVDMSRSIPGLNGICAQYCAVETSSDQSLDPRDAQKRRKQQEDVLKKFRMHECNLLLATPALEEGIDLPRCNLVVRWDVPASYRSHGLCRGRARAARAVCALLAAAAATPPIDALIRYLATYRELDQIITRKCGCGIQDEPPQSEEDHADCYTPLIKPYTPQEFGSTEEIVVAERNVFKNDDNIVENSQSCVMDEETVFPNVIDNRTLEKSELTNKIVSDKAFFVKEDDSNKDDSKDKVTNLADSVDHRTININITYKYTKTAQDNKNNGKMTNDKMTSEQTICKSEFNEKTIENTVPDNVVDSGTVFDNLLNQNCDSNFKTKSDFVNINENKLGNYINKQIINQLSDNSKINEISDIKISEVSDSAEEISDKYSVKKDNVNVECSASGEKVESDLKKEFASVDLSTAIALINRYCGKLPSDTFTRLAPQWWMEEVTLSDKPAYICTLRLPLNCPVKYNIVGHPMPTRVLARRMVALQACRILHKSGELDNQLMPIGKENFKAAELETSTSLCDASDPNDAARPGTTKRRQYYFKRTAWTFTDCQPIIDASDSEIEPISAIDNSDTYKENEVKVDDESKEVEYGETTEISDGNSDAVKVERTGKKRNMLYAIVSSLWCALPERYNTRGRRLHAPQLASQALGILMPREEADDLQIPAFPVYTRSGEVRVSVEHVPNADVRMSPRRGRMVRRFMRFVFAEVLRVRRRGMKLHSEGSTHNNYYIVPTIKTTLEDGSTKIDIDWSFLELIYQYTEDKKLTEIERPVLWGDDAEVGGETPPQQKEKEKDGKVKKMDNPLLKEGETFMFDAEKYREAVVTPWYRNQDQPQFFLVAEICWNLSPDSAFPSATHTSFRDYYSCKYGVTLTQSNQPLLDVDHTSARLNLLTPRYVNRKGVALPVSSERTRRAKRDRLDQKQILVPELCRVHPFAAPLWFATVALPCVLYRINALLIADEIRRAVAIDVGLGIPKIDEATCPGFKWPPLDFGWSLAEVLNADLDKDKKKDDEERIEGEETAEEQVEEEIVEEVKESEVREKTINEILQEKENADGSFEIGTWSNDMASSIPEPEEYDELMEPLPSNLTFCTSMTGKNWCEPVQKPKNQFNPTRNYSMADSDCSYMSSDFDTDDSDLNSEDDDEDTDASAFCSSKNSNAAMGVRIEYKTAHEAEAVDVERKKKTNPAPQPDEEDDAKDRKLFDALIRSGEAPKEYTEKFRNAVAQHQKVIEEKSLIKHDKPIVDILPDVKESEKPTTVNSITSYLSKLKISDRINKCNKDVTNIEQISTCEQKVDICNEKESVTCNDIANFNEEQILTCCKDVNSLGNEEISICNKVNKDILNQNSEIDYNNDRTKEQSTNETNIAKESQTNLSQVNSSESFHESDKALSKTDLITNEIDLKTLEDRKDNIRELDTNTEEINNQMEKDKNLGNKIDTNPNDSNLQMNNASVCLSETENSTKDIEKFLNDLFPYGHEKIVSNNGQICLESIEKNKRVLLNQLKKNLTSEEVKNLNCFSMKDVDIDSPNYVNEKLINVGFDKKENYEGRIKNVAGEKEFKPYYMDNKGQGKEFDFDYQPDLEGHPGPSPSVILQALTMSNANDGINLERLETIGDSFLKFAITAYLYCAHPTVHEGKLSHMRSKQVSNLNLYRLGRSKRLGARMIASKFEPHDNWLPPCHKPPSTLHPRAAGDPLEQTGAPETPIDSSGCFIPYNLITQHSIPDKSIADCVEALIGAYLLECGPRGALLFMSWLGIRVLPRHDVPLPHDHPYLMRDSPAQKHQPPLSPKRKSEISDTDTDSSSEECEEGWAKQQELAPEVDWTWKGRPVGSLRPHRDHTGQWVQPIFGELKAPPSPLLRYIEDPEGELERMLSGYDSLERTLQYRFRDRSLLLQALTHASHQQNRLTDCYQRLEFLGDAILDYLITRHLYEDPRRHSPGALTDLRSALVNNTIFATLAARHGFHKYFRHMSPGLNEVLTKYVKIQEENGHSISEEHYLIQEDEMEQAEDVEVPKALGDLFESVAGAIFLDSGMSLGAVWRSYVNLMGAELEAFSAAAPKSPVRELLEAEPDTAKFGKPERLADGRRVRVCVEVFGRGTFKGVGRNYRIAKGFDFPTRTALAWGLDPNPHLASVVTYMRRPVSSSGTYI